MGIFPTYTVCPIFVSWMSGRNQMCFKCRWQHTVGVKPGVFKRWRWLWKGADTCKWWPVFGVKPVWFTSSRLPSRMYLALVKYWISNSVAHYVSSTSSIDWRCACHPISACFCPCAPTNFLHQKSRHLVIHDNQQLTCCILSVRFVHFTTKLPYCPHRQ